MKRIYLILYCTMITQILYCQVGIGTTTPEVSSVLDISSTDKGFLFPRMTTVQRDAIVNPAKGLIIYNIDEDCLQVNSGSPSSSAWACIGGNASMPTVISDCDINGFEGMYANGGTLTVSNKFSVTIINNSFSSATIDFSTDDLVLSGFSGLTVNSVSTPSETIASGDSLRIEYTLSGTLVGEGILTGVWTKLGLTCTSTVLVTKGDALFDLPQTVLVASISNAAPLVDIQGVVDNVSNQFTVSIPYTGGIGTYDAYAGTYVLNETGSGEGGDANSFRLTYPSGTFSASGSITATIEVDGDESFNAEKQSFGIEKVIAALDFQVNGNSKGNVNLGITGGIPDRNFTDANHKFIYLPITAADGNIWLNNNLGANYSNINHPQFNPAQQATAHNDHHAYGSLFQWGRYSDGHELINYTNGTTGNGVHGTTSTNPSSNTPGHNLFVTEGSDPYDWRVPQNDNLWQGEAGINNPCPEGYRVPTETEFDAIVSAYNIINITTAASSSLAFSTLGSRNYNDGVVNNNTATTGSYWTSTIDGTNSRFRSFDNNSSYKDFSNRVYGYGVRCIKN